MKIALVASAALAALVLAGSALAVKPRIFVQWRAVGTIQVPFTLKAESGATVLDTIKIQPGGAGLHVRGLRGRVCRELAELGDVSVLVTSRADPKCLAGGQALRGTRRRAVRSCCGRRGWRVARRGRPPSPSKP
jgi:hypothetical protein